MEHRAGHNRPDAASGRSGQARNLKARRLVKLESLTGPDWRLRASAPATRRKLGLLRNAH